MRVTRILPIAFLLAACSTPDDGPTVVGGAVAVAAGDQGSCAIGSSGGLACWGAVPDGTPYDTFTVGDGPDVLGAVTIETPVELISLVLQRTVDGGGNHGCVVGVNNATYCWGTLLNGHTPVSIGDGITALAGAGAASTVAMDRAVLCVTRTDNKVRCFGSYFGGGRGTDSVDVSDAGPNFTLTATGLSPTQNVIGTAVGYMFGCALRTDSLVACWGSRHRGQLAGAVADTTEDCSQWAPEWCQRGPAPIAGGAKYRQVSAQWDHACATRIDGGVDCWGRKFGALVGTWWETCVTGAECVNTPTAVSVPGTAIRVAVGYEHACALTSAGEVYCWGDNSRGQLGRPGGSSDTPVKVSGGFTFTTISAGQMHTCALEAGSGAIGCWGGNHTGQLGDGTTVDRDHPVAVIAAE